MAGAGSDRVFVSHSRRDKEGRLFVRDLLQGSPFEPDFYPLSNTGPPHAGPIRKRIANSTSIFVVLSPQMIEQDHTRAWVAYEIGVAAGLELPVVVIEPEGADIPLKVPGATHYLRRPKDAATGLSPAWKHIARTAGRLSPSPRKEGAETLPNMIWEALYNVVAAERDSSGLFSRVVCEATDCRIPFYAPDELFGSERIPCPVCRRPIASLRVKMTEKATEVARVESEKRFSWANRR